MIASGIASGGAQAILLPIGKVLIAANVRAQLYDPATGTFTAAGPYVDDGPGVYTATCSQTAGSWLPVVTLPDVMLE